MQFTYCIMRKLLWQRFWLDLCTEQMVSARACANRFLPSNSSGTKVSDVSDGCTHCGKFEVLFISVGGGGAFWAENVHVLGPKCTCAYFVFSLTG